MSAMWFYAKDGEQQGPVAAEVIRERLRAGDITDATLVWKEGMAQWSPLGEVLELREPVPSSASQDGAPVSAAAPVQSSPSPAAASPYQAPQLQQPMQQNGMAIASMVLGICVFFTCGFTGLIAVPLGHIARSKIRNSATPQSGDGMALAGLIMGYLGVAIFVGYMVLIVIGIVSESSGSMP